MIINGKQSSQLTNDILEPTISFHNFGKFDFILSILKKLRVREIIDEAFTIEGHEPDISYGSLGMIFIANIICDPKPLCHIGSTFTSGGHVFDFKGTLGEQIELSQLTDDRFAKFLDRMYEIGNKRLFTNITINALIEYGFKLSHTSYDTTTKTMWGVYEYEEDKPQSILEITYGYNKQKRKDKRQIVIGLGMSEGLITDTSVMSGNMDDKSYNTENIKDFAELKKIYPVEDGEIRYTADSAACIDKVFKAAKDLNQLVLTRMPDNYNLTQEMFEKFIPKLHESQIITIVKENGEENSYNLFEDQGFHKDIHLKTCVYFSHSQLSVKYNTIAREVEKEKERLEAEVKKAVKKALFTSKKDAHKYKKELKSKKSLKKLKYHDIVIKVVEVIKPAPGPKAKDSSKQKFITKYDVQIEFSEKEDIIDIQLQKLTQDCMFMLVTNDFTMTGEEMLKEYKKQSSVETKFKQLKNDFAPNSLYLKKPERVESLMYLILIGLQVSSVIEKVVRDGLAQDNDYLVINNNIKSEKPTFLKIIDLFDQVGRVIMIDDEKEKRFLSDKLTDSHKKVLRYLGLDERIFSGNTPEIKEKLAKLEHG